MRRFYSNRLCRHQQESFQRGKKKKLTLVAATNLSPGPPPKMRIMIIKQKEGKTLGVQSWYPEFSRGSAGVHWLSAGGGRRRERGAPRRDPRAAGGREQVSPRARGEVAGERSSCAAPRRAEWRRQRHWAGFKVAPHRPRSPAVLAPAAPAALRQAPRRVPERGTGDARSPGLTKGAGGRSSGPPGPQLSCGVEAGNLTLARCSGGGAD